MTLKETYEKMTDEELLNELEKTEIQRESVKKLLVEEILKRKLMIKEEIINKMKEMEKLIFQKDKENKTDLESKEELVTTRKFIYKCLSSKERIEVILLLSFLRIISLVLVFFSIALGLISFFLAPTLLMIIIALNQVKGENPDEIVIDKRELKIFNDNNTEYILLENVENYELKNISGKKVLFIYFKNRVLGLSEKQYHNFDEIYPFLEKLKEESI